MSDPSTFPDDFVRSFAAALGLTYEEMSADHRRSTEAEIQFQLEEGQRRLEAHRAAVNERATRLMVVIASDNSDRLIDLMLSSDPRQRKRGERLYRQALNAQHNARWATLERINYDA